MRDRYYGILVDMGIDIHLADEMAGILASMDRRHAEAHILSAKGYAPSEICISVGYSRRHVARLLKSSIFMSKMTAPMRLAISERA